MEIKIAMMFLEMARFWRRVFFWFCFILFKCQVVRRFQGFIKKSKLKVAKPNNTHHTIPETLSKHFYSNFSYRVFQPKENPKACCFSKAFFFKKTPHSQSCPEPAPLSPSSRQYLIRIWRSRVAVKGKRRVNYFVKHLMVDEDGEFSKARFSRNGQHKDFVGYLRGMMKGEDFPFRVKGWICFLEKKNDSLKSKKKVR